MNAIVSVTRDWAIGLEGALVVSNREDMRRFVRLTMGGTVVMGRKTLESFPGGPLKGRRNVVISRGGHALPEGCECVGTPEAALAAVAADEPGAVWLIGGESVYRALLPHCDKVFVTLNETSRKADAFFPRLDEMDEWRLAGREEGGTTPEGVAFSYLTYHRNRQAAR